MSKLIYISDFFLKDTLGGAELVDDTVINYLKPECVKSSEFRPSSDNFLILSNLSLMDQNVLNYIADACNYIIVEHDYKIHHSRFPWQFKDSIIPQNERINYKLYNNAKAVFVQTDDHLDVYRANQVPGNFVSLKASIWSEKELSTLSKYTNNKNTHRFAVVDSFNWIKNKQGAEAFCNQLKLDYTLISSSNYDEFIQKLSCHPCLVFFPIARESCCRLLVEARCLNLNVITNNNSGAFKSNWFSKSGLELINFLKTQSESNLKLIESFCPKES